MADVSPQLCDADTEATWGIIWDALPIEDEKEAIRLVFHDCLSLEAAARAAGVGESVIKRRLARACMKLRWVPCARALNFISRYGGDDRDRARALGSHVCNRRSLPMPLQDYIRAVETENADRIRLATTSKDYGLMRASNVITDLVGRMMDILRQKNEEIGDLIDERASLRITIDELLEDEDDYGDEDDDFGGEDDLGDEDDEEDLDDENEDDWDEDDCDED